MVEATDYIRFESDDFQRRLITALARVEHALQRYHKPYITFSSGKDSIVITALVHKIAPNTPLLWSDDELEYPETVNFMGDLQNIAGSQLTITLGNTEHAHWFTPWQDQPFWRDPLAGSIAIDMLADTWQARLGHDLTIWGLRGAENKHRRNWFAVTEATRTGITPASFGTGARFSPIWDWSSDDVWTLIAGWNLPYNQAYKRLTMSGISRDRARVGPLPLTPREHLARGWPDLLDQVEHRYGKRWE